MVQNFTSAIKCRFRYVVQGIGSGTYVTEYEKKKCMAVDGVIKCNITSRFCFAIMDIPVQLQLIEIKTSEVC
jgi:hypothetical protein